MEFSTYFLMRYVIFTVSLVTLQHLHKLQILVIFFLQIAYMGYFGWKLMKDRLYDAVYDILIFFVQEMALSMFLAATTVQQFMKTSLSETQFYEIEMVQVCALLTAFGIEFLGVMLGILRTLIEICDEFGDSIKSFLKKKHKCRFLWNKTIGRCCCRLKFKKNDHSLDQVS